MHRTLVWTSKGGTGKTTTVANAGPELARLGYRVLMVGFDPQGDLETTFGIDDTVTDVVRIEQLLRGAIDPRTAAVPIDVDGLTGEGSLRLLASSSDLHAATTVVARRNFEDLDRILEAFDDEVDLALIDTQGAFSPLSHTAARAADSVLFTMEPGFYEYRALAKRLADLEQLERDEGWTITPLGVLFVRTDIRSRHMREYREHFTDAEAFGGEPLYVFNAHTRQQSSVRDHPRLGQPTVLADPASHVAADYREFAAELVQRIAASAGAPA
jgi:chromosome partitioning protein